MCHCRASTLEPERRMPLCPPNSLMDAAMDPCLSSAPGLRDLLPVPTVPPCLERPVSRARQPWESAVVTVLVLAGVYGLHVPFLQCIRGVPVSLFLSELPSSFLCSLLPSSAPPSSLPPSLLPLLPSLPSFLLLSSYYAHLKSQ